MDSPRIVPGVPLFLPVFSEGALLFLGDGHAAQSHGELAGTGIEVSMEVEIGVDLLPSKTISKPRGEDSVQRFTMGIDRPLENALQTAVTEMLTWLQEMALGWTTPVSGLSRLPVLNWATSSARHIPLPACLIKWP